MTDWRDRAACLGMWPETWFPHPRDRKTAREAKRICKACPVRTDCLVEHFDDPHGIYGGTTPDERKRLTRPQPRQVVDQVAINRRANGDHTVTLTDTEVIALARQLRAAGYSRTHIEKLTGRPRLVRQAVA